MYLETYGCQMNVNDTEIAWAILQKHGYTRTKELGEVKHLSSSRSEARGDVTPLPCLPGVQPRGVP